MKYAVCCWPDLKQMTTIVRVCRTLEAAKKVANRSDRLFVIPFPDNAEYCRRGYKFLMEQSDWQDVVYMIPQQNHRKYGYGRYGNGLRSRDSAPDSDEMERFLRSSKKMNMKRKINDDEEPDSGLTYKM